MRLFLIAIFYTVSLKAFADRPLFDYQIKCANPFDCNPSVGGLIGPTGMCTTFLVAPDVVGTNKHCLPEALQKSKASCAGKFEIVFPALKGFETERLGCKHIEEVSPQQLGGLQPDYAFIRLSSLSKRPPLKIDDSGVQDGENLQMWAIKFYSKEGLLHILRCPAVLGAFINPFSKTAKSPLIVLKDCPIVKGNSGSPIVDSKNNIRGVVAVYEEITGSTRFGGGFNFSCLRFPEIGLKGPLPPDCNVTFSKAKEVELKGEQFKQISEALSVKIEAKISERLKDFVIREAPEIQFGIRRHCGEDSKQLSFSACRFELEPHCFAAARMQSLKGPVRTFATEFPYWEARIFLDESLKPKDELKEGSARYQWKYNISEKPKMLEIQRFGGKKDLFKIFACPSGTI